jgi:hypothetical protein
MDSYVWQVEVRDTAMEIYGVKMSVLISSQTVCLKELIVFPAYTGHENCHIGGLSEHSELFFKFLPDLSPAEVISVV